MHRNQCNTLSNIFSFTCHNKWVAATRDEAGQPVYFTIKQFLECLPPDDYSIVKDHFYYSWGEDDKTLVIAKNLGMHPAIELTFYHKSIIEPVLTDPELPTVTQQAERLALIAESVTMYEENEYRALRRYCAEYITPFHYPLWLTGWTSEYCRIFDEFTEAWVQTYARAAVRRMRALGTNRPEALGTIKVDMKLKYSVK